jgi:hypothetical protein
LVGHQIIELGEIMLEIQAVAQRGPIPFCSENENEVDERQLETNPICRFAYVAKVLGLEDEDFEVLNRHARQVEPYLSKLVERVYEQMFQFPAMKRHFLPAHFGFYGHAPDSMEEVSLDHAQTKFRKKKLLEYFQKLGTAAGDETFAAMLDMIANMHTPHKGNALLSVPMVQIAALLGFMSAQFVDLISKLRVSEAERLKLQQAYNKLFWVQNAMFLRHHPTA